MIQYNLTRSDSTGGMSITQLPLYQARSIAVARKTLAQFV
jgi:hypothetical protein